jgi:hypothetical protein
MHFLPTIFRTVKFDDVVLSQLKSGPCPEHCQDVCRFEESKDQQKSDLKQIASKSLCFFMQIIVKVRIKTEGNGLTIGNSGVHLYNLGGANFCILQ